MGIGTVLFVLELYFCCMSCSPHFDPIMLICTDVLLSGGCVPHSRNPKCSSWSIQIHTIVIDNKRRKLYLRRDMLFLLLLKINTNAVVSVRSLPGLST